MAGTFSTLTPQMKLKAETD
ncbi:hypothetical protein CCACVL1_29189 [Corchorus capsularis]|uniref:Uncharacterized protein n=1 Tax=Corchorus capsularis TaxID=210143 RepID=A0A1R3G391_COCAP|nr:hypothetical protein CCACVL1_29189 [Corchorus capsularis]